jgi:hypothetical protein
VYQVTNQRQAHTKAEERDPFLRSPTKHSLPEPRKWPRPLSPSRRKSKKSEDQAEHRRTLPEAAKIYTYATRANKTVGFAKCFGNVKQGIGITLF